MTADQLSPNVRNRICTHMNNDHQDALIELAKQLIHVQFLISDLNLFETLWNEVAQRKIDPRRIII